MLWRLTLAVAAVCAGGMCSCAEADLMSRLIVPRDYGVKLCGREFIRAVIFTCGGSRWKRSTYGDLDPFQRGPLAAEDEQLTWQSGTELTDRLSSPSLADLVALFTEQQQQLLQLRDPSDPARLGSPQPGAGWGERDAGPAAAHRPVPSKKKRNFSLGVAGMCCSQGCTKNDIGRLC